MRNTLLIAALGILTAACGSSSATSDVASTSAHSTRPAVVAAPIWGEVAVVTFSRDARPLDGDLVEVTLKMNNEGTYDASHHVVTSGFGTEPTDTTKVLASGLTCENAFADEIGTLTNVLCQRDSRPVDGPLTKVNFQLDGVNTYSAALIVVPSGHGTGDTNPRVTDLGGFLALAITSQGVPPRHLQPIYIEGATAQALIDLLGKAGILGLGTPGASIETSLVAWSAAQIDCNSVISSGTRRCSIADGSEEGKTLSGDDASAMMNLLAQTGVPALWHFEGRRYAVINVSCTESFGQHASKTCSFLPKAAR